MKEFNKYSLICLKCHHVIEKFNDDIILCPNCDGPLSVEINKEYLKEKISKNRFFDMRIKNMWTFFEFLPLLDKKNIISLNEGNTPIVESSHIKNNLNINSLSFKFEFLNPTGSFKDRQISMGMSKAIEMNKKSAITMSSGNVGAAVAAYSSKAGIPSIILIPKNAPESKILQIKQYGGNVFKIDSDSTQFISKIVKSASLKLNMANLVTAAIHNPFINYGAKTISYEIAIQSSSDYANFPDVIIIPVGGAGLLSGVYTGFKELQDLDYIERIPRLIGVQPEGCAPFVNAIQNDLSPEYLFNNPWKQINTISTALADDIPFDCYSGIPAIRKSKGTAITVSDEETLEASKNLSRKEGIFAEPSSCVTVAALRHLLDKKLIKNDEKILCLITGSGFKDIKSIKPILKKSVNVDKDFNWKKRFEIILT